MKTHRLVGLLLIGTSGLSLALASTAASAQTASSSRFYDIPPQPLGGALSSYAERTGIDLVFSPAAVKGKRSRALRGSYSPDAALDMLLEGTNLRARKSMGGSVVVESSSQPAPRTTSMFTAQPQGGPLELAQADPAPGGSIADARGQDEEIVVTGIRASLRDALRMKRNTEVISDNISSEEIGQLPDVTIAEELNRLPGVNTTRDRGNASQASVRGLGPRLVFGLVNGREVASSEPSQDIRWEIYPSEVLAGVQVYKAQDAAIVPGGIAATIDIRTLRPLDYNGPTFSARFGPTYNEAGKHLPDYSPWGYRGSLGVVTHLTDRFAIALAGSIQKEKNGFPDFRTFGWNTPENAGQGNTGDLDGDGTPDNTTWGLVTEAKNVVQDRKAIVGNVGWQASDSLTINFDSLYSKYTIDEDQFQTWYANNILGNWQNGNAGVYNAPGNTYEIINGTVVAANLTNNAFPNYQSTIAKYTESHDLFVAGANAEWRQDDWTVRVDLSHSKANRENRWAAIYLQTQYGSGLQFDIRNGRKPSASLTGTPWDPAIQAAMPGNDPSFNGRDGQSDGPEFTKDRVSAATFDVIREFGDDSFLSSIQVGGRLSDRVKRHRSFLYNLCAGSTTAGSCDGNAEVIDLSDRVSMFEVHGFEAPPMVYGDFDELFDLVYPANEVPDWADQMLERTRTGMKSTEGYAKLSFKTDLGAIPLNGSLGVRVAQVRTRSSGNIQGPTGDIAPITIRNEYTDVLPSLNVTAHLSEDQLLRFGASVGISRPPLDALVASFVLNPIVEGQPPTGGGGNPTLMPYKAQQLDLSYENYFHAESLFAVALYYKHLKNFIGASSSLQSIDGVQYIITGQNNGKGGDIFGAEVTFQSRLFFLPGFLQDFGIYANYAHVWSNVEEFAPASNPYRMVGLAKHTAQFDAYYSKDGFEARIAVKHHSPFTVAPGWVATVLKRLEAETLVDASISYQLTDNIGLRFQARNLTNQASRLTSDNNVQNLSGDGGYQLFGRSYLADVSFKF